MTKILSLFGLLALVILPISASAQLGTGDATGGEIGDLFGNILNFIDAYVIPAILSIGFLVFVWGIFQYFILGGANDEAKESGKSLIMYAIAGFVLIIAFWGIINIVSNGIGLEKDIDKTTLPKSNLLE